MIVEDEDILREVLTDYLTVQGYQVLETADGEAALELFQTNRADLVILDVGLPKVDGWSVCCRLQKNSGIPIIILTARSDEDDSLLGYELGTGDYLIKPYSPKVLTVKVKRFLERQQSSIPKISSGSITVSMQSGLVAVDGVMVNLIHTEFEILAYLMQNKGILITREQLITKI